MDNYSRCAHIFSQEKSFERAATELLQRCRKERDGIIMRITIFGECADNDEYVKNVAFLESKVLELYNVGRAPMVSYVTQPLLDGGCYVAEMQTIDVEVTFKEMNGVRYLTLQNEDMKRLVMCGVIGDVNDSIRKQSDTSFEKIAMVFEEEGFAASDIFKQWNYIPQITAVDSEDYQNYQAFNDSRSEFYRTADWTKRGYPAATGIGMECGAVTVDLLAVKPLNDRIRIIPIDNDLQLAAHVYTQEVLIGMEGDKVEGKSTPKFERAKAMGNAEDGYICFISGTAAIRGEASLEGGDVVKQTIMTMENIEHLISDHTCNKYGIELFGDKREVQVARAYVKYPSDTATIKRVVDERWSNTSVIYVLADVCREELLIEIEAVSNMEL